MDLRTKRSKSLCHVVRREQPDQNDETPSNQSIEFSMTRKNVAMAAFFYFFLMSVRLGRVGLAWQWEYRRSFGNMSFVGQATISRQLHDINFRQHNETLVILLGSVRGGEKTWETIHKNLLDPNQADLALAVGWDDKVRSASTLFPRANYVVHFPEFNNWSDAMDLLERWFRGDKEVPHETNRRTWRDIALAQENGLFGATREDPISSGAIQNFARWWVSVIIENLGLQNKYSRFIVTRADYYYNCETDLRHFDYEGAWVPVGEDYHGLCDRFIMLNSQNIIKAMDIIPSVIWNPDSWNCTEKFGFPCGGHIETAYETRLAENKVGHAKRFERTMFASRLLEDISRWGRPEGLVMDGLYYKYKREYADAMAFCCARDKNTQNSSSASLPFINEMSVEQYEAGHTKLIKPKYCDRYDKRPNVLAAVDTETSKKKNTEERPRQRQQQKTVAQAGERQQKRKGVKKRD